MTNPVHRIRVAAIETLTSEIKKFAFIDTHERPLPEYSAGSHIIVTMRDGEHIWRNPYSLVGRTDCSRGYVISVQRSSQSRGGSVYMHTKVDVGSELDISEPVNLFPVAHTGRRHILVAGGIGITPILAMAEQLKRDNKGYELHYAVRSEDAGAFVADLVSEAGRSVKVYRSDRGERIPLVNILSSQPLGTHLYVCGPQRMIDWAIDVAKHEGWPAENVHYEHFSAPPPGRPFDVKLARSAKTIHVGDHQSVLEAMEQAGVDAPYLCRGGACGQCVTKVIHSETPLLHNDHYLTDEEKRSGTSIATCVSRAEGGCVTLDL
jgi:ferredoxin-NADP reductase